MSRRLPALGALILVLLGGAAHVLLYRGWLVDDAWISWRYARNLAAGHGPVYNVGEMVEGYSNPLWVLLGSGAIRLGSPPEQATFWIAAAAALGAMLLAAGQVRRARPQSEWAPVLAAGALAVAAAWARHAGNGLETTLFATLVLVLASLVSAPVSGAARATAMVTVALAVAWLRPEGVAYVGAAAAAQLWGGGRGDGARRGRALVPWLVVGLALAASLAFRWRLYGSLVPNTYYAKMTGTGGGLVDGVQYVADFAREGCGLLLPALAAVPLVLGTLGRTGAVMLGAVLLAAGFAVGAGGDWMLHYRFLAPALPPLAVLAGLGAADLAVLARRAGRTTALAGALTTLLLIAALGLANAELALWRRTAPARAAGQERVMVYHEAGRWLAEHTPPGALVAASDIGAVGETSARPILDMFGLVDAHVARRPGKQHHKADPEYVLERRPTAVVLIRDAAAPGRYARIPDMALWRREEFQRGFALAAEFPLPADGEVVEVYLRRDDADRPR
ncbi:MAG TPA: hypothetical protein P5571_10205 [Candidatus Krumholzibacteria bacterium]|nr:hypothetical protein [Candidatus Krumholzibacteria bacterium]HRX51726.1 hypothetical protein [Candidatus Krumholzibacteria bacterium]